jgi:hypothetical protein
MRKALQMMKSEEEGLEEGATLSADELLQKLGEKACTANAKAQTAIYWQYG